MDEVAELQQRTAELEAKLADMAIRHSALEWMAVQHFSHYLAVEHPDRAEAFLDGISAGHETPYVSTSEGERSARPDHAEAFGRHTASIVEKVRRNVRAP